MFFLFFFNDTATTEIYTLSLHDALPILTWSDADDAATVRADIDFYGFSQCPGARLVHHWMDLGSAPAGRGEAVSLRMRLRGVRGFAGALRRSLLPGRHHFHRVRSRDRVLLPVGRLAARNPRLRPARHADFRLGAGGRAGVRLQERGA